MEVAGASELTDASGVQAERFVAFGTLGGSSTAGASDTLSMPDAASHASSLDLDSNIVALTAFYKAVNPDKVGEVQALWDKYGIRIWNALGKKYPGKVWAYVPREHMARPAVLAAPAVARSEDTSSIVFDKPTAFSASSASETASAPDAASHAPNLDPDSNVAALTAFFKAVKPDRVDKVQALWDKYGIGIWNALMRTYPVSTVWEYVPRAHTTRPASVTAPDVARSENASSFSFGGLGSSLASAAPSATERAKDASSFSFGGLGSSLASTATDVTKRA
jgi:hypothetical protein